MSAGSSALAISSGASLRDLAFRQVDQVILGEIERARFRLRSIRDTNPKANRRELVDLTIDRKRSYAGTGGLISGFFGAISVPLDLVMVAYLQVSVAVDIALLYDVNLKSRAAQRELLEVILRTNGINPVFRGGTPVLARLAYGILRRRGWPASFGRAIPLMAMPYSAWANSRDVQRVGRGVSLHYEGLLLLAGRRRRKR